MSQNAINIDLQKCPTEECTCGCPYFKERMIIKRIPGLMAGSTTDQYAPVKYYVCEYCGKPHPSTKIEVPHWSPSKVDKG